jgi:putative two-component system response regulator
MLEGIPFVARIVHIVDVFDALGNERPYKRAWPLERCLEEIERQAGRMFDPELVALFLPLAAVTRQARVAGPDESPRPVRAIA